MARENSAQTEILQVDYVSKRFGIGPTATAALNRISFSVEKGSFVSVIGRSGSGKSTMLQVLGGLMPPDEGTVMLQQINVYGLKERMRSALRRKKIGFVFQSFNLVPEFTVMENICLPSYLDGARPDMAFLTDIFDLLDLKNQLDKYPYELSGGEQQRTALARALSTRPAVLLADEPTGHLDVRSGEEVMALIRSCHRAFQQTIVLATHDLGIARESERIITLEDGAVLSDYRGDCI